MSIFWSVLIMHGCWILSKAFSSSVEMITWLRWLYELSFNLLIWCITLIDLCMLNNPCIPGINPTWTWCSRVPWTARRSNQSTLKEISPGYSLEGLMLKLELQYFGHLMQRTNSLKKTLMLGKIEGRRRGMTEVAIVGWYHWLDGQEFEQSSGVGEGQGSMVCCPPWGCKESDMTEQLNWTEMEFRFTFSYWISTIEKKGKIKMTSSFHASIQACIHHAFPCSLGHAFTYAGIC